MNSYLVEWGDFAPLELSSGEIVQSSTVDDRTLRSKEFITKEIALAFAHAKLKEQDDWLAFIEVKEIKLLEKVK